MPYISGCYSRHSNVFQSSGSFNKYAHKIFSFNYAYLTPFKPYHTTATETSLTGIRDAFEKVSGAVIRRLSGDPSRTNFHVGHTSDGDNLRALNSHESNTRAANMHLMSPASVQDTSSDSNSGGNLPISYNNNDNESQLSGQNETTVQQQFRIQPISNTFTPPALDINLMDNFLFHPITGFNMKSLDPSDIEEAEQSAITTTSTTSWL